MTVMFKNWKHCRRILCIRADNMGDVIMTGPAMRALKESFQCHITLLTSGAARDIGCCMQEIDEVVVADLPWVKRNTQSSASLCLDLANKLAGLHFDGAIIFTVYSQSALPAAMLVFLAGIPLRLAYCRENPYELLTDWVPDKEPYQFITHQVARDLELVKHIGATTRHDALHLQYPQTAATCMFSKLQDAGVNIDKPWMLLHPGVSEPKRLYPAAGWAEIARLLYQRFGMQLLISGTENEASLGRSIAHAAGMEPVHLVAGLFTLAEFIGCVQHSRLVVTVNTATTHIAAALQVPQVVLYATTNPQHTPWKAPATVLHFPVQPGLESKNEIIKYVATQWKTNVNGYPAPVVVAEAAAALLTMQKAVV